MQYANLVGTQPRPGESVVEPSVTVVPWVVQHSDILGKFEILHVERWAIALSVIIVGAVAISLGPTRSSVTTGLRVESLGPLYVGRPALLRVSVENPTTHTWIAPPHVRVRTRAEGSDQRRGDWQAIEHDSQARGPWHLLEIFLAASPAPRTQRFEIEAAGLAATFVAHVALGPTRALSANQPTQHQAPQQQRRDEYTVRVEGGVLTPEVPAVMVIATSLDRAAKSLDIRSEDVSFLLSPERVTLDACGTAVLYARPAGLAAVMSVTLDETQRTIALPMAPGAVLSKIEDTHVTLVHAAGGVTAYVLMGDELGPTQWSAHSLETARNNRAVQARLPLPPAVRWVSASVSADFETRSGSWREPAVLTAEDRGVLSGCQSTESARLYARISRELPDISPFVLLHDGARQLLGAQRVDRARSQNIALAVAAVALVALSAVMTLAVYQSKRIEASIASKGASYAIVVKGVVALVSAGFALWALVQLRAG
jgi:hypothetical protein